MLLDGAAEASAVLTRDILPKDPSTFLCTLLSSYLLLSCFHYFLFLSCQFHHSLKNPLLESKVIHAHIIHHFDMLFRQVVEILSQCSAAMLEFSCLRGLTYCSSCWFIWLYILKRRLLDLLLELDTNIISRYVNTHLCDIFLVELKLGGH